MSLDDFDNPWYMSLEDGELPSKERFFPKPNEHEYSNTWFMEDFLQHNSVFVSGFGSVRRKSHCDAYGTIVDFAALDVAYNLLVERYHPTEQDWSGILKSWSEGVNSQMPLKLVAIVIRHKLAKEKVQETLKVLDASKAI
jgi:hypothetical protein